MYILRNNVTAVVTKPSSLSPPLTITVARTVSELQWVHNVITTTLRRKLCLIFLSKQNTATSQAKMKCQFSLNSHLVLT